MAFKNFKLTNQRLMILDYIKDNYSHPTVEDVFEFVKKRLPRVSKKTVYSNLKFLTEKGLVNEVKVQGVQRYEPKLDSHHHLVCRVCDSIFDIKSDELSSFAMKIGENLDDFYVESLNVNFYGLCKKCKEGEKNERRK